MLINVRLQISISKNNLWQNIDYLPAYFSKAIEIVLAKEFEILWLRRAS